MNMVAFHKIEKSGIIPVENFEVYDIELEKNHYFSANNVISHNCRLKNMVATKEFNFTNGNMGVN